MNNIRIERLKNKLGTHQLPTAELLLDGTMAQLIGEKGHGISLISPLLLITCWHNTISAVDNSVLLPVAAPFFIACTEKRNKQLSTYNMENLVPHEVALLTRLSEKGGYILSVNVSSGIVADLVKKVLVDWIHSGFYDHRLGEVTCCH
uniref:Uncharacterized protein n=1 Tax=Amphimedon queenslandica TaxID=400682 RepID=A0A1X7TI51_AMPQE